MSSIYKVLSNIFMLLMDWDVVHDDVNDVKILELLMHIQNIKSACEEIKIVPVTLVALDVDALDVPGNLRFFEGASYGRLNLKLMIPNGDIAPRIVVVFALVVSVSTIALSPFFDQPIVFSNQYGPLLYQ